MNKWKNDNNDKLGDIVLSVLLVQTRFAIVCVYSGIHVN